MIYKEDGTFLRQYKPISVNETVNEKISIDWSIEYKGEYHCPFCEHHILHFYSYSAMAAKVIVHCGKCRKHFGLSCRNKKYSFRYQADKKCPNPLCFRKRPEGFLDREWIFIESKRADRKVEVYRCRWCDISFTGGLEHHTSWAHENKIREFRFEDESWDLRNFFDNPSKKTISFESLKPGWYKCHVKKYIWHLLQIRKYSSSYAIAHINSALNSFGHVIKLYDLSNEESISREIVLSFLDSLHGKKAKTIQSKINHIKNFLDWLGLDVAFLIRTRDIPKREYIQPDWLDEDVRNDIKKNLCKIPSPIAAQYLVQEFTAARVGEVCKLKFNCLSEENGEWYISFFQKKVNRWHKIPASREIRRVIENQQSWIRENIGDSYQYLFCHFRGIVSRSYPIFPGMRPLPEPPRIPVGSNQMVRIIQILIERENIKDKNGSVPHFKGKITRSSRLQEVRTKYGIQAAQLYAGHQYSDTTFQHYAPPTSEEVARADLPFQALLVNSDNKFLPWQTLPDSLLKNPKAHELDIEISPRLVVYGHCALNPKTPCPYELYPKCYGCKSFCPSTDKLPLYERQYGGEKQRMQTAKDSGSELAYEESQAVVKAMDKWLPDLRELADGKE